MTQPPQRPLPDQERDPALFRAWTEQSRELPPPARDQAILAAAHRAVNAGPRDATEATSLARRPQRWWMPLAAAAVIGVVAIGVIQVVPETELIKPHEKLVAVPPTRDAATAPTEERSATPREIPATPQLDAAKPRQDAAAARQDAVTPRLNAPAPPASTQPPAAPPVSSMASAPPAPAAAVTRAAPSDSTPRPAPPAPLVYDQPGKLAAAPEPFPGAAPTRTVTPERKREVGSVAPAPPMAMDGRAIPAPAAAAPSAAMRGQHEVPPPSSPALPAPPPSASDPTPSRAALNEAREERQSGAGVQSAPAPPPSAASATGRFAAAPAPAPRAAATESDGARRPSATMQAATSPLAKSADSGARTRARDPDAWIARIRKLRADGDVQTAERELREFRELVPDADARIPADLRVWAATVR